jgi:hypothetical protein
MWAYIEHGCPPSIDVKEFNEQLKLGTSFLRRTQVIADNQRLGWPNVQENNDLTYSTVKALLVFLQYEPENNLKEVSGGLRRLLSQQNEDSGGVGMLSSDEAECWTRVTSLVLKVFLNATKISSKDGLNEELSGLQEELKQAIKGCVKWLWANKRYSKEDKTLAYWSSSEKAQNQSVPATALAAEALFMFRNSAESKSILKELRITNRELDSLIDSAIRFIVSKKREDGSFPDLEERKVFPTYSFQSPGLGTTSAISAICKIKPNDRSLFHVLADAVYYLVNRLKPNDEDGSLYYSLTGHEESTWATAYAFAALGCFQKAVKECEESWLVNIQKSVETLQKDFTDLKEGVIRSSTNELKTKVKSSFKDGGIITLVSSLILLGLAVFNSDLSKGFVNLLGTIVLFSVMSTVYFCRCFKKPKPVMNEEQIMPFPKDTSGTVENLALYRRIINQLSNSVSKAKTNEQYFSSLLLWKKRRRFLAASTMMMSGFVMAFLLLLYLFQPLVLSTFSSLGLYLIVVASVSVIALMTLIYVKPTILIPKHT